jgi:hypothetical protein
VLYFDTLSLAHANAPAGLATRDVRGLWNSPDLRTCALACEEGTQVYRSAPVAAIIDRPPADWLPADVAVVAGVVAAAPPGSRLRPLLDLLLACLDYRFGADVGIGDTAGPSSTPDDIALVHDRGNNWHS